MEIMVYSLPWVMHDLYHQPYEAVVSSCFVVRTGWFHRVTGFGSFGSLGSSRF